MVQLEPVLPATVRASPALIFSAVDVTAEPEVIEAPLFSLTVQPPVIVCLTLDQSAAASALTIVSVWPELSWLNVTFGALVLLFLLRFDTRTKTTAASTT